MSSIELLEWQLHFTHHASQVGRYLSCCGEVICPEVPEAVLLVLQSAATCGWELKLLVQLQRIDLALQSLMTSPMSNLQESHHEGEG